MVLKPVKPPVCRPDPLGISSAEFVAAGEAISGYGPWFAMQDYRSAFRTGKFADNVPISLPPIAKLHEEQGDEGMVSKFLLRVPGTERVTVSDGELPPGLDTESVLIPMIGRLGRRTYSLCVSSQVGCAMGCTFCETAQMGLIRSLTASEIVAQWFTATHVLKHRPSNIVFMGMGEPLDNYDEVIKAIAILIDHNGAAVPASKITISTVGRVDGIRRLSEKLNEEGWKRLNIALSLNAAQDSVRDSIMPINRKWNLAELREAFQNLPRYGGGKFMFEYVLIPSVNDRLEDVQAIADFIKPLRLPDGRHRVCLNLIPYNPRRNSPWPAPAESEVTAFMQALQARDVYVKRRRTKGRTMMGACGQLGNEQIRARKLVQLGISASK